MRTPIIQIQGWQDGASLNDKLGRKNGFEIGNKVDFGSRVGYVAPGYAWRRIQFGGSDDMPTRFTKIIHLTNGETYLGGEDAKIYKLDGLNNIVLARTSTQSGAIRDMVEYKDYLIYSQATTIGRYGPLSGSPSWTDNWQTGKSNVSFHPLLVSADNELYYGNRNKIDRWDGVNYTSNVMEIGDDGWLIRCLEDFGQQFIAIGASYQKTTNQSLGANIFLWDREIVRWNDEIPISEREIKAIKLVPGYLWVWAGRSCNLYVVPLNSRVATRILTFSREEPYGEFEVYPNSVVERDGVIHFGLSKVGQQSRDKNPCGIYSFPVDPLKFTLNIPLTTYFDGSGFNERYVGLGVHRGAVDSVGDIILASYWDLVSVRQYLLRERLAETDASPYRDEAVVQSFTFTVPKDRQMYIKDWVIEMLPFPSGCLLSLDFKRDYGSWQPILTNFDTVNTTEKKVVKVIKANTLQLRLKLRGSLTNLNRPFVKAITGRGAIIIKP